MCVECFLVWVGVDCLCFVSRVKDLKQWASVFSATCGCRNHRIEWLREVKGDKYKARCIVCMKDVEISSMGESALTSQLKGKKHQTLTSQERSSASVPDFLGVSSQRPATKSHDAKVVSKSASSESGKHSKLNATKSIASSSGSSVMEKSVTRD